MLCSRPSKTIGVIKMISDEYMMKAAHRMEAAAEQATKAADRMEESVRKLSYMLEDGYGGNALKLIELLENVEVSK